VTLVARRAFSGRSNVASSESSKSIAANYLAQRIHRTRAKAYILQLKSGYAWFKTFKPLKPFTMSEKQSGAVERSATIERLEWFEPAPLLDAIARYGRGLRLVGFAR
jgi:hypothetical protein